MLKLDTIKLLTMRAETLPKNWHVIDMTLTKIDVTVVQSLLAAATARMTTAMLYGPDMKSSRDVALQDVRALLEEAVAAIKRIE